MRAGWAPIAALALFVALEAVQVALRSVLLAQLALSAEPALFQPDAGLLLAEGLLGLGAAVAFLLCVALWLAWELWRYRAMTRLPGASWSSTLVGVAGWWFVPGAHLTRPRALLRELWCNAVAEAERPSDEEPGLLRSLWTSWMAAQGLWLVAFWLEESSSTVVVDAFADLAFSLSAVVCGVLAAAFVFRLDQRYSTVQVLPP